MMHRLIAVTTAVLALTAVVPQAGAANHHLIICGAGGEAPYQERFVAWGKRLRDVLADFGNPAERIALMTEDGQGSVPPKPATLDTVREEMTRLAAAVTPDDIVFIYLIGHGSYLKDDSKFNLLGPDLTAKDLDGMLDSVRSKNLVVINTASTSAGWINELSAPNRIIASATKSIDESNATEFTEHFIAALEEGSADRNHDDRISVLEACQQATELTNGWYTREGFIATEHAILDDNGDGLGSRLPIMPIAEDDFAAQTDEGHMPVFDGDLANNVFLKDYEFPATVPRDLIDHYLAAISDVEALKAQKSSLSEEDYYARLEGLLIQAATLNAEIHRLSAPAQSGS